MSHILGNDRDDAIGIREGERAPLGVVLDGTHGGGIAAERDILRIRGSRRGSRVADGAIGQVVQHHVFGRRALGVIADEKVIADIARPCGRRGSQLIIDVIEEHVAHDGIHRKGRACNAEPGDHNEEDDQPRTQRHCLRNLGKHPPLGGLFLPFALAQAFMPHGLRARRRCRRCLALGLL